MKEYDSDIAQYHLHKAHPEKLQFELYDLNSYRQGAGENAAIPHSHSYYQIIWFCGTSGTHTIDFERFEIKKNTILFVSKDQIHAFDDNLEIKGWLIHFNESFFMNADVDIFLKYNIFNSQRNPCYTVDKGVSSIAFSYISMIQKELEQRTRFGHEDVIRFLLKSLLINLERIHIENLDGVLEINSFHELQFLRFKELIEENYKNKLSVKQYADILGISSKTLTAITKSKVNKTPLNLISERLVLEAKRFLKFSTLQISEISYKIGFDDPSYFIKFFKRNASLTPSDYRNHSNH